GQDHFFVGRQRGIRAFCCLSCCSPSRRRWLGLERAEAYPSCGQTGKGPTDSFQNVRPRHGCLPPSVNSMVWFTPNIPSRLASAPSAQFLFGVCIWKLEQACQDWESSRSTCPACPIRPFFTNLPDF